MVDGGFVDVQTYLEDRFMQCNISGIIRIPIAEYGFINRDKEFLTHFNLQVCQHKVGDIYVLPKIMKHGYFDGEREVLPDLNFDNVVVGECVEVMENVSYTDIRDDFFVFSFENIKNVEELKVAIFNRYSKSMPNLNK